MNTKTTAKPVTTKPRYILMECSNPVLSWVRNEETGEDMAEGISTVMESDDLNAIKRRLARLGWKDLCSLGHHFDVWDRRSSDWNKWMGGEELGVFD